ncbi:uncharacterized protein LOC143182518 [Calliopsis andreniformis]|uniref:uncharacterized protein LOC143182518 n=1 Tax=Calliopsis andreniformis TaxID=337506 RepID=UPI003FCCC9AB
MENEISAENSYDQLSQSYCEGISRIVGLDCKKFVAPRNIIKRRAIYWSRYYRKYLKKSHIDHHEIIDLVTLKSWKQFKPVNSKQFCSFDNTELDFNNTLDSCGKTKPLSVIQYWVNTGNFPYKILMDQNNKSKCNELMNNDDFNDLCSTTVEELNEYCEREGSNQKSSSTSVDTAAYILSNMNTTNKEETMAIVEGAKGNTVTDIQNVNSESHEIRRKTVQLILDKLSDNCSSSTYSLTSSSNMLKPRIQQNNNNVEKDIENDVSNYNTVHTNNDPFSTELTSIIEERDIQNSCSNETFDERSVLTENSTKLNHRKKLYSGRDSPVDLVRETNNNRNTMFELQSNLHPALDPVCKMKQVKKKRRITHLGLFKKKLNGSRFSVLSPIKHKRRKITNDSFNDKLSVSSALKKRRNLFPLRIVNNFIEKNSAHSIDEQSTDISLSTDQSVKSVSTNKKLQLSPTVSLKRLPVTTIQKNRKSNKKMYKRNLNLIVINHLNPVVSLKRLSESDILKYTKINATPTTGHSNLNSTVHLNQSSVSDIQKREEPGFHIITQNKSNDALTNVKHVNPIVCLQKLSESEIKAIQDKTVKSPTISKNFESTVINVTDDTESDKSTLLIIECQTSDSSTSNFSVLHKNDQPSSALVKTCSYNKKADNSVVLKKPAIIQRELSTDKVTDSVSDISKQENNKNISTAKKSEEEHPDVRWLRQSPRKKNLQNQEQNTHMISHSATSKSSYKNEYSRTRHSIRMSKPRKAKSQAQQFLFSDDDDEFLNFINESTYNRNVNSSNTILSQNLSKEKNINHMIDSSARSFKLSKTKHFSPKLTASPRILNNKKRLLINGNIQTDNKLKTYRLQFQTKMLDSDSEASSFL